MKTNRELTNDWLKKNFNSELVPGIQESSKECPVARAIRKHAHRPVLVLRFQYYYRYGRRGGPLSYGPGHAIPSFVAAFIRDFDDNHYPDLIATPSDRIVVSEPNFHDMMNSSI